MTLGAADAVRGASSPADEMAYIVSHSESCAIVAQDSQTLERLAPALASSSSQNGNGSNGASHNGVQISAISFPRFPSDSKHMCTKVLLELLQF